ncbi:MAG: LacI family DNA-binding transcriptional regulator [Paracoccaceae bacterium]|nr:LacI family DNA-binding transcriptional regulator [Paracoccaceae bacterium]
MKPKASRRPTHGRATAQDVADLAGVSLTTVSRAFNPDLQVAKKTRELVRTAADQLHYAPNMAARALASRRSNLIGLLVNNFDDPEHLELYRFVSAEAQKRGFHTLLLNIAQEGQQVEAVDSALQYQVDGLLVSASRLPESLVQRGAELQKPVVVVGRRTRRSEYSAVYCDNVGSAQTVADFLYKSGCKRPALIGGSPEATVVKERAAGFVGRIEQHYGFQPITRMAGTNGYETAVQAVSELLTLPMLPDGFFCTSDLIAVATSDTISQKAPDLRPMIVGYGGTLLSRLKAYQFPTVQVPVKEMAVTATSHLIDIIEGKDSGPKEITFPCDLLPYPRD